MMTHTYTISGMSCASCVEKITKSILALDGAQSVDVSLEKGSVTVQMSHHIPTAQLQKAVSAQGDYRLTEDAHAHQMDEGEVQEQSSYSYRPLILVLGFILLVVAAAQYNTGEWDIMEFMRSYMAGFFIVFSFFKILDLKGFAYSYLSYDIITKAWMPWGFIYPFIELAFGLALLTSFQLSVTLWAIVVVMGLSSIGVIRAVLDKRKIQCACLGTGFDLPMSTVTIIEDLGMVLMALLMLWFN